MNYATIDKELFCVVATLREFRSILLGAELLVHKDHKHILNIGDSSQWCLRWISYVDEYEPELHYAEGPLNVIADTFSRLLRNDESSPLVGKKAANVISDSESDNDNELLYSSIIDDKEILNCLLSLPCISSNRTQKKRHAKHRNNTQQKNTVQWHWYKSALTPSSDMSSWHWYKPALLSSASSAACFSAQ